MTRPHNCVCLRVFFGSLTDRRKIDSARLAFPWTLACRSSIYLLRKDTLMIKRKRNIDPIFLIGVLLFILLRTLFGTFWSVWSEASGTNPVYAETPPPTDTPMTLPALLYPYTQAPHTAMPTDTLSLTPTITQTATMTPTQTSTSTETATATDTPLPPFRFTVDPRTAHDVCGTWLHIFITVDGNDAYVSQWWECWLRETREDGWLIVADEFMVFDFAFQKAEPGFDQSYITAILPFGFHGDIYEVTVYCDDECLVQAFYDAEANPFWQEQVFINQGMMTFPIAVDEKDGYFLITHKDHVGGSSAYLWIRRPQQ